MKHELSDKRVVLLFFHQYLLSSRKSWNILMKLVQKLTD